MTPHPAPRFTAQSSLRRLRKLVCVPPSATRGEGYGARGETMPAAFIYDHVRTPRGRGKADGSLHEVTALNLAAQALGAIKQRSQLDPELVDDVVLGCVDPVGE